MFQKNPGYRALQAYYDCLHNNVVVDNETIAVYTSAPRNAEGNRIIISGATYNEYGTKDAYIFDITMTLDIITEFSGRGSRKKSEDIADETIRLIKISPGGAGGLVIHGGFKIITNFVDTINSIDELTDEKKIYRKSIIFRNQVEQI